MGMVVDPILQWYEAMTTIAMTMAITIIMTMTKTKTISITITTTQGVYGLPIWIFVVIFGFLGIVSASGKLAEPI